MTASLFCPATMCPLFAANGSRFSGAVNARCERGGCRWFDGTICQAGRPGGDWRGRDGLCQARWVLAAPERFDASPRVRLPARA